ncbi:hypothetical protein XU18_0213 [Perkinsela sp. CCAP 1560/4]|nr:hypothetical protein XU18_0213 [Perkinsela sp. CCAP 1560/4]|eukprot:KNH09528.1 hypothetical protein XU18_0213 [Perkinsela sp. CCAP 1560/4]
MNSDYSDDDFHDTNAVYDWESLLEDTEKAEQVSLEATKKEMNNARKHYKKRVLKIGEVPPAEKEELSLDSLSIRQKLVEKWSDLKGVTARNVKLLHEQSPSSALEIEQFFDSTLKLLPNCKDETKHFGSFITALSATFVKALLQSHDETKSSELIYETITKVLELHKADLDTRREEIPSDSLDVAMSSKKENQTSSSHPPGPNIEDDFM